MTDELFAPLDSITNETGIVFGYAGSPYLEVAVDCAAWHGRKVGFIAGANIASANPFADKVTGAVAVDSTAALNSLINKLKALAADKRPDAIVFHGLAEYAANVLGKVAGDKNPEQSHYGEMARIVSNDLIELSGVIPVLYVTCDIIDDPKSGETRFNIIPGLRKLILGNLVAKLFVTQVRDDDGRFVPAVQDNPEQALKYIPARKAPARVKVDGTSAAATANGKPRRQLK